MKSTDLTLVYVCTRGRHELRDHINRDFPGVASVMVCVTTPAQAMRAVTAASGKRLIVFTSNMFHRNAEPGADGKPEHEMTGAVLARLIKEKCPTAEVYLLSEFITDEPVFDGRFKQDMRTGAPSNELRYFLQSVEAGESEWKDQTHAMIRWQAHSKN